MGAMDLLACASDSDFESVRGAAREPAESAVMATGALDVGMRGGRP
jgi:hypothetical protein